jgi:hypothetical protein
MNTLVVLLLILFIKIVRQLFYLSLYKNCIKKDFLRYDEIKFTVYLQFHQIQSVRFKNEYIK